VRFTCTKNKHLGQFPKVVADLPSQVVNDKGRYHFLIAPPCHRAQACSTLPRSRLLASVKVRDQVSHPLRRDSGRSSNRNRHLSPWVNTIRLPATSRGKRAPDHFCLADDTPGTSSRGFRVGDQPPPNHPGLPRGEPSKMVKNERTEGGASHLRLFLVRKEYPASHRSKPRESPADRCYAGVSGCTKTLSSARSRLRRKHGALRRPNWGPTLYELTCFGQRAAVAASFREDFFLRNPVKAHIGQMRTIAQSKVLDLA
jgi:hypothetical protein